MNIRKNNEIKSLAVFLGGGWPKCKTYSTSYWTWIKWKCIQEKHWNKQKNREKWSYKEHWLNWIMSSSRSFLLIFFFSLLFLIFSFHLVPSCFTVFPLLDIFLWLVSILLLVLFFFLGFYFVNKKKTEASE